MAPTVSGRWLLPLMAALLMCNVAADRLFAAPAKAVFNGTANTFVYLNDSGVPQRAGLNFSLEAVDSVPSTASDGKRCIDIGVDSAKATAECEAANASTCFGQKYRGQDFTISANKLAFETNCVGGHMFEFDMPNATEAALPFTHLQVNWMTMGHFPPGIYTQPHWDLHFFIAPKETMNSIGLGYCGDGGDCKHYQRCNVPPVRNNVSLIPEIFLPSLALGAFAAQQAFHMVDVSSPELAPMGGGPPSDWNMTWIYGGCAADVWFWEPMIRQKLMQAAGTNVCKPIPVGAAVQVDGWYPNEYCLSVTNTSSMVYMQGFQMRKAEPFTTPNWLKASNTSTTTTTPAPTTPNTTAVRTDATNVTKTSNARGLASSTAAYLQLAIAIAVLLAMA